MEDFNKAIARDTFIGKDFVYFFTHVSESTNSIMVFNDEVSPFRNIQHDSNSIKNFRVKNEQVFSRDERRNDLREELLPRQMSQSHTISHGERQAESQKSKSETKVLHNARRSKSQ